MRLDTVQLSSGEIGFSSEINTFDLFEEVLKNLCKFPLKWPIIFKLYVKSAWENVCP